MISVIANSRAVTVKVLCVCLVLPVFLSSCTYLKYAAIQSEYARIQKSAPGQVNLKHMIDRETFFVIGRTIDETGRYANHSMAIAAYCDKFKPHERVDTMYFSGAGTHYGLSLPSGEYRLLVFADSDNNQLFDHSEVVGRRDITLDVGAIPEKVLSQIDVKLTAPLSVDWDESFPLPETVEQKKSLFYPAGAIRSLDDPLFDERMATLGMYDPATFLGKAPTMFYALEEDLGHKIPVVFVHGIGGTPRSFIPLVKSLDRERYKPWFFYYPSGGDLDHLAELFYSLFLSGKVIWLEEMPMIIVAHSMGGLIVREALNKYKGRAKENRVELLVTIASPLGGHAAAASGERRGFLVLPAWRDLNPNNRFIKELYRKPLPDFLRHHLIYAYNNSRSLKIGENSDGVVPLSSQLHPAAQQQSDEQFGFNSSHTGILYNAEMIGYVVEKMSDLKHVVPDSHLVLLRSGGYEVDSIDEYSPLTRYYIRVWGKYLVALANGVVDPINPSQERLMHVLVGKRAANNAVEKELRLWLRRTGRLSAVSSAKDS